VTLTARTLGTHVAMMPDSTEISLRLVTASLIGRCRRSVGGDLTRSVASL